MKSDKIPENQRLLKPRGILAAALSRPSLPPPSQQSLSNCIKPWCSVNGQVDFTETPEPPEKSEISMAPN